MKLEAGGQLGHYHLVEKIGEGGMGVVWKAVDTTLDREVAIKVLPEATARDPQRIERLRREAKAIAALDHPNIVAVHSVGEADGHHFIAMQLAEGTTLDAHVDRGGVSMARLFALAIPLADALSAAHRQGIAHRDLKPSNVIVSPDGRIRVLDFGLAKPTTAGPEDATLTAEGSFVGTVPYMAPEQAQGMPTDVRADVFSLGVILHELATGERPFRGENAVSVISSIVKDTPADVTEVRSELPRHLGRIVRRCLAKKPERRYQSALELRNELEELKSEVDSGLHAVEPRERVDEPPRTSKPWLLLGAVAVLAIAVTFMVTAWMRTEPPTTVYESRPITSAIGYESDLDWSPESEFIAFGFVNEGSFDVMVQPVTGGAAEVRADGPGDETTPRWSPDGKYLAYVSSSVPGSYIYLVPPHGGTPRRLIDTNIATLDVEKVSASMGDRPWSLDGKTLLVSRVSDAGQMAIHRVDRDTEDTEQLTFPPPGNDDLGASYSFDGERIVFQRRTHGKGTLMMMPAAGGEPEVLLADEFEYFTAAWRPDDRHLVFRSNRGGGRPNLWEMDTVTGSMRQLTFETYEVISFSVSSDDRIAYVPFWHDTFLFTVDVATGERRQLTSHTKDNFGARFSPDGQTIAYHSTRTGNSEVWLHHPDGRPETQITDHPGWDLYPDWSPDGSQLIFVSNRDGGRFKIFIANSDGGGERLLADEPLSFRSGYAPVNAELVSRWSPDGEQIAYLVTDVEANALWTMQPDGANARKRLDDVTGFDWYRDSRRAVITRQRGSESELIAVDLESGREQSLFLGPLMEFDVAPDGSAVAFCYGRGHMGMGLVLLRLEPPSEPGGLPSPIGEPEHVVRTEGYWHVHNGGWSADSRSLVYTRDTDYGDVYELVEKQ